jgi:hypothetical protein
MSNANNPEIRVTAKDDASRVLRGIGGAVEGMEKKFQGLRAGAAGAVGAVAGVVTALAGLSTLVTSARAAIDLGDSLDDLAEKTGVSASRLSELRFASEVAGTSFEDLQGGLRKLGNQIAAAGQGQKEAIALFKDLGVSATNADGSLRGVDEVLLDVADAFSQYRDGAGKSALAQDIFGKSGASLIPVLNKGSAGIRTLTSDAQKLGAVIGDDAAKAAADFNDNLTVLRVTASAAFGQLVGELLPSMNEALRAYINLRKEFGSTSGALAATTFSGEPFKDVEGRAKAAAENVARLKNQIQALEAVQANANAADFAGTQRRAQTLANLNGQLATQEKLLRANQSALDAYAKKEADASGDKAGGKDPVRAAAEAARAAEEARKAAEDRAKAFAKVLEGLDKELIKTEELSRVEQLRREIRAGLYGPLTQAQIKQIELRGKEIDAEKAFQDALDASTKAVLAAGDAARKTAEERQATIDRLTGDALAREQSRQLSLVKTAYEEGAISAEKYATAVRTIYGIQEDIAGQSDEIKSIWADLGATFESAFENASVEGKGFSGILKGIEQDILRVVTRMLIIEPIIKQIKESMKDKGGGTDWLSQLLNFGSSFFGGGGTPSGGSRALGGTVRPDNVYRVGESGPELFVPPTNGRIIPNKMLGQGGGMSVVINQTLNIDSRTDQSTIVQAMGLAVQQAEARIMDTMRRGGMARAGV